MRHHKLATIMLLSGRPSIWMGWTRLALRTSTPRPSHGRAGPTSRHAPCLCLTPRAVRTSHPRSCLTYRTAHASRCVPLRRVNQPPIGSNKYTVSFMHFRCMFHMFHLDVAKVDLVLHILQWLYTYVSNISAVLNVCCKCFIWMLQWLYMYVTSVCSKCFRPMLQVFHLDVAYVSNICCKRLFKIFHLFQTYVASVFI